MSGTATQQMIEAIASKVRMVMNHDELGDKDVDTGEFEASGVGKQAEPSALQPVEGAQSSIGEY